MNDVIAAVSTANGTGGVAVIRLSGDGCLDMAKEMFSPSEKNCAYEPNRMYPGFISGDGFKDYGLPYISSRPVRIRERTWWNFTATAAFRYAAAYF